MRCNFFKDNGIKCEANALKDGGKFCFSHDPRTKEELRKAWAKGGGMSKKNELDLPAITIKTSEDVVHLIEDTVNRVRSGELPINTANCFGYLAGIALKAIQASDVEKRLEMVENIIGELKHKKNE